MKAKLPTSVFRIDGSSKAQSAGRPSTPVETAKQKPSPTKTKPAQAAQPAQDTPAHRESPLVMSDVKNGKRVRLIGSSCKKSHNHKLQPTYDYS